MKTVFALLMIGVLFGCQNQTSSDSKDNESSQESLLKDKIKQDSLRLIEQNMLEDEIKELESMGALGKWRCDFSGYESEIILYKENNKFYSQIDFTKSNMKTKTEKLKKQGDKFFVIDSKVKEYYKTKDDGNLELGDQKGLFTNAVNIMPGAEVKDLPSFEISESIGKDIFYISGNYSKSFPKTLDGTNSKEWKVYYEDINVIFTVDKSNNKVLTAEFKE
ncbi:MAG: hypothetical protein P8O07_02015 [Crocinitomicaceae bacterium]|nr:hypothetical protein [Crocinitomicaceae bacterium]